MGKDTMSKLEKRTAIILVIFCSLIYVSAVLADTIELQDGTIIEGKYMGGTQNSIRFQVEGQTKSFATKDVLALFIHQSAVVSGAPAEPQQAPAAAPQVVTVPAGTFILVRMTQAVDSSRHRVGHKFTAKLEADLVANNQVAAERGSNVYGRLTEAKQAGRVVGKSELTLELTGIMVNNQIKPVVTSEVKAVSSQGSGRSTARRTAGGAVIGGAIGGKDGARTGAGIGAGVSILTRGSSINIPSGTLLEFRLASPFTTS